MSKTLFDFSASPAVLAWSPIDDRVMGGRSNSRIRHHPAGHAIFEGEVSLANNGGFASVRSSAGERGLAGASVCFIELLGDNKQFKLGLVCGDGFDSLSYQASFAPVGDNWQTLRIELADFQASFRGRPLPGAPPLDPSRIRQVGLLIAARQAGSFALHIKRISLA